MRLRSAWRRAWAGGGDGRPRNWSLTLAVLVAFALRVLWAVIGTHTPTGTFNDAAAYLQIAKGFSFGELPTLAGRPSAFYAPGYPILLAPFVYVGRKTGLAAPEVVASMLNVAAGTATVVLVALLARRWMGERARNPAAWLMAVAPAHVYFVPTAHGETVFAAMAVGMVLWITGLADRAPSTERGRISARHLLLFGVIVPFAVLIRGPGLFLFLAPAMALRATAAGWRAVLRATVLTGVGGIVGFAPGLVMNGVNAGVWTPVSTQNATAICVGHHEDADGRFPLKGMTPKMSWDCYRFSPFDDPALDLAPDGWKYNGVDENRWYRQSTARGIRYALTHPGRELWLTKEKMAEAWSSEWDALPAGSNYLDWNWTGSATTPLNWAANGWLYLVEALTVAGLVLVPACRRAVPVWGSALLITLSMVAGLAQPHFRHGAMPFLVVIAAGAAVGLSDRWRRRRQDHDEPTAPTLPATPTSPPD